MKRIAILTSIHKPVIDAVKALNNCIVEVFSAPDFDKKDYDLVIGINYSGDFDGINSHYSLLPAFDGEDEIKQAFLAGVKVTGITFYYTNPFKIIAQYPVFIKSTSHYDDTEREIEYIEQVLYPIIIEKILNNEQFEIQDLLKNGSCGNNCSSCGGCR